MKLLLKVDDRAARRFNADGRLPDQAVADSARIEQISVL